jgi:hypothetical protein
MNRFRLTVVAVVCTASVVAHAETGLAGKWQGTTGSGRKIVLDAKVKGHELTGKLTLAEQTADIMDGKVEGKTFSFKAALDGRTPMFNGRFVGEVVELTVEGVADPLTLKRVE